MGVYSPNALVKLRNGIAGL